MGLRKGICYREIERPYTRKSKYKKRGYVKAVPNLKIVRFEMGDVSKNYDSELCLISKESVQIRQNALESVRMVVNRALHEGLGLNYHLKIRVYPHHVLRENKMLTGAGADRMSTGMQHAFGRPVGTAAQVKKGQCIMSVKVNKEHVELAKNALGKVSSRLPCSCNIEIKNL